MFETVLSKNLKVLMASKSIDEATLAERTGVAVTDIRRIISGAVTDPRISIIIAIAEYFNFPIEKIMSQAFIN
jgi:transcriptional regulator with XRE-family HTH domain